MSINNFRRLRQPILVAVLIERLALDILHDEVWLTIIRLTRIDQARDIRMIEARKNLPLSAEAHAQIGSVRTVDYFDRNLA